MTTTFKAFLLLSAALTYIFFWSTSFETDWNLHIILAPFLLTIVAIAFPIILLLSSMYLILKKKPLQFVHTADTSFKYALLCGLSFTTFYLVWESIVTLGFHNAYKQSLLQSFFPVATTIFILLNIIAFRKQYIFLGIIGASACLGLSLTLLVDKIDSLF